MAQLKFSNILWDGMGAGATVARGIVIFLKVPQYQQWADAASCYHMGWPLGFSHRCKAILRLGWFQTILRVVAVTKSTVPSHPFKLNYTPP